MNQKPKKATKKRLLSLLLVACMVLSLAPISTFAASTDNCSGECTHTAAIGNTHYDTLQEAIEASNSLDTVTLLADMTCTDVITVNKSIMLDLNGKTIENTAENKWVLKVDGNSSVALNDSSEDASGTIKGWKGINVAVGSSLIMYDGNVVATGATGAGIQVYGSSVTMKGGSVTAEYGAILMYSNGDARGTFTMEDGKLTSKAPAIYANGSEAWDDVDATILDGEISGDEIAIYWPADGKLTIAGGKITGGTAVYVKSGSLEITDGELIATGTKEEYAYDNSGASATGDALVIENVGNGGFEAISSVSITGGSFVSENANAVASYTAGLEGVSAMDDFIAGGTFDSDVSSFLATGYELNVSEDGGYSVAIDPEQNVFTASVGGVGYASLADAIDAADYGDVVTLLADVTGSATITIDESITLDLNGKTIKNTANNVWAVKIDGNSNVALTDSSEDASGTIKGWKGVNVAVGSSLIMNDGNVIATGATGAGIQVYGSSVTMKGGSVTAEYGAILMYSKDDVRGTFTMEDGKLTSKAPAIYANGSEAWDDVDATILDGEISGEEIAIYWPADGKLTIAGGKITGKTAVYVKSGSLEITDGELVATGDAAEYVYDNSGASATGDALVIENVGNGGFEAISSVSITGGSFTSANASAVASYTAGVEGVAAVDGFVKGGSFSTALENAYLASGFVLLTSEDVDGNTIYGVAPELTGTVTISGTPAVGETLTVNVSDSNNTGDLSYQWYRLVEGQTPIDGATSRTYTVTAADAGYRLYCVVNSSVQAGSIGSYENATNTVPYLAFGDDSIVVNGFDGVYDGADHILTVVLPNGATIEYSTDGENWSGTCPSFRDAGTYTVQFRVRKVGYSDETGSAIVVIAPKTVTITADNKTANVGDAAPSLSYTVEGLLSGDALTTEPSLTCDADMSAAGEYAVVPSGADAGSNYAIEYVSGKLTVEAAAVVEYTITYMVDGTVYKTETYPAGASITMPEVPAKDGYVGAWDKTVTEVTGDVTVTAVYTKASAPVEPNSPQTGDNANLWLWFTLLVMSACGVVGLSFFNIRRKGYSGKYMR